MKDRFEIGRLKICDNSSEVHLDKELSIHLQ